MAPPRSPSYERLESGHGTARQSTLGRFGLKKFAVIAVAFIGLVYVFGPRKEDILPSKYIPSIGRPRPDLSQVDYDPLPAPSQYKPKPPPSITTPRPTSPDNDPDLSKTVYCTAPYSATLPLVQYALMIDAGSTGSRIHVYKFNNCGPSPAFEYEVFKMMQPGLSAFAKRPQEAAASLDVLLDVALRTVPEGLRACTPIAVKATAGLRLLGARESTEILEAVRARLHEKYPFSVQDVEIMDGKDEGVFAWITANYLLNTIRGDSPAGAAPYAVLDLGGASTQIVFEPAFSKPDASLEEGEHKYELQFGGKTHVLYQHSYLGYGLIRARDSVHRLVEFMNTLRQTGTPARDAIANPCLARGTTKTVEVSDENYRTRKLTMVGEDVGSFEACNRIVELVMAKDAICEVKPCSFNGVYQPSLMETLASGKILLLSYFYDRLQPFLPSDHQTDLPLHVSSFGTLAEQVCLGRESWVEHFGSNAALMEELEGRPEWCLDLTFMHALLRLGYELDADREIEVGKQVDGTELGWCLGATLAMIGGDLECKI